MIVGVGVGGSDLVLADPVVEPEIRSPSEADGEVDEELIGF